MSQVRPGEATSSKLEKTSEKAKGADGTLDKAPDAPGVRNATAEAVTTARDANPDRSSGSAGGNPDDGSFTLIAVSGNETTVIAERAPGSGKVERQSEQTLVTEQDLLARATSGDYNANLLLKELSEIRNNSVSGDAQEQQVRKLLMKASRVYPAPVANVNAVPPSAVREHKAVYTNDQRTDKTTKVSDMAPHLTPHQVLEKRFGVKVVMNGDIAEYHLHANGRDNLLFSAAKHDTAAVDKRLRGMVQAQEQKLTAMYGVTFSSDTETAGYVLDANLQPTTVVAHCRSPRLDELIGIEAGLGRSSPSQFSRSGKPLEFVFIRAGQHHISGRPIGANYEYGEPPKVFMDPCTDSNVATELDKVNNWGRSTEYQVIHELTHGAQERIGFKEKGQPAHETIEETFAAAAGWVKNSDNKFYLKGKSGEYYKCDMFDSTKWTKYTVGKDGLHAAGSATSAQVRDSALVTPPTDYLQNPTEEMAECLTAYRLGGRYRDSIRTNPKLYELISRIDQADINKGYPPDDKGNAQYVRTETGGLAKNPLYMSDSKGHGHDKKH